MKTAQGNMRHTGPEIILRRYAQVVTPEMQSVRVRCFKSCVLSVGQNLLGKIAGAMQSNEPKRSLRPMP